MIDEEIDAGGSWEYISRYAEENDLKPLEACLTVVDRVATAVSLIMDTATELGLAEAFFTDVIPNVTVTI
jgi:hypothetical protein